MMMAQQINKEINFKAGEHKRILEKKAWNKIIFKRLAEAGKPYRFVMQDERDEIAQAIANLDARKEQIRLRQLQEEDADEFDRDVD